MSADVIELRPVLAADFPAIVELNRAVEQQTSAMDAQRLAELDQLASYHRLVEVNGDIAGFLIAMTSGAGYKNANFDWFSARYERFVYVDRVVVSDQYGGHGLGSALYRDLFAFARDQHLDAVVCEYNLKPPNPASSAFHDKWGFREVGSQWLAQGSKKVSMQRAALTRNEQPR